MDIRGGRPASLCSQFQTCLNLFQGGGGQAYLEIFPNFSRFFLVTPPPGQLSQDQGGIITISNLACQKKSFQSSINIYA